MLPKDKLWLLPFIVQFGTSGTLTIIEYIFNLKHKNRRFQSELMGASVKKMSLYFVCSYVYQKYIKNKNDNKKQEKTSLFRTMIRIFGATVIFDTLQFWTHFLRHKFAYKGFHSEHHLLNQLSGKNSFFASQESLLDAIIQVFTTFLSVTAMGLNDIEESIFMTISIYQQVLQHSGYDFTIFPNNGTYHSVHHNPKTKDFNFEQPFYTFWDTLMGTRHNNNNNIPKHTKTSLVK